MAYTNDAALNDTFQMMWIDGTAGFATASLAAGETLYADADDLVFHGPADLDDEDDDLDDEDIDEDDDLDDEDDLEDDDDFDEDEDEDDEDIDEDDEYEDEDDEDEDE